MKTIPPSCPEPEFGRKYWRSLGELEHTAEFQQWVEREFPAGASEWTDPVSRRHFVKIMSASFMLAGLGLGASGCRRPEQRIFPFSKMPENYVHGVPQFYATAMPTRGGAIPLVVRSNDGRPTKIEGNDLHPDSNGGTDRWAQASILSLYDPDRAARITERGQSRAPELAFDFLTGLSKTAGANGGKGLSFLLEPSTSPSRRRLQEKISQKYPQARWYVCDPLDTGIAARTASQAFGKSVRPVFRYDAANVIVSLDCDFIGAEEDAHNHIRRFTQRRRLEKPTDSLNRLYILESLFTLTGVNADHRLRIPSSLVHQAAAMLAAEVFRQTGGMSGFEKISNTPGIDQQWISECAKDLVRHRGQSLVVAGHRQPEAVHLLSYALNSALGNVGKSLLLFERPEHKEGNIVQLAASLNAGEVETLVILGGNPAYNAPVDLNWAATQRKAKLSIRLGFHEEDETTALCDWHFPATHYLESWGDALTTDGTLVPIQPLIAPLFGGFTELEILARVAGEQVTSPYDIVRETFSSYGGGNHSEADWRKFLHEGFLPNSAAKAAEATFNTAALAQSIPAASAVAPSREHLELVFQRDYKVDDGRYSNVGWLQELPDPITKMVWDNAILISRKTASEFGLTSMDVVELKAGNQTLEGPLWVQPGFADYSLGLPLGYGRPKAGRVGRNVGFNAYSLRTSAAPNIALGATLRATGRKYTIACTQDHWSLEGRPIIREANLEQFRRHPDFVEAMKAEEPPGAAPLYPNPFENLKKRGLHQWGMSIDLNLCVGCSACMLACQSENNIPIVGKDQVRRGREMHWIRIDRYYAGKPGTRKFGDTFRREDKQQVAEWIDEPQAVTQPMLCQHCEAAPCENVCPVNATVHDQEGLNLMVYNRCVGTRYCSNNCPYKVRRFNYFDYNKRPLNALYRGPFGHRPDDEIDLIKMIKNPDVTVRMRGVMEKCTFCIQRIEGAKIAQKVKARDSGEVLVPEGTFTTACAQACPAGAIVFGNLNVSDSRVSKLKKQERNYTALEFLLTKPRLSYLARIRNQNPAMPDFYEWPLTFQEYEAKTGDPFQREALKREGGGVEEGAEKGARP